MNPNQVSSSIFRSATIFGSLFVVLIVGLFVLFSCVEFLDANHVMVIQYPNGELATFTDPGPKPQWFGNVTKYPRRVTYSFSNSAVCTQKDKDGFVPFKVQFNDGGVADLCGSLHLCCLKFGSEIGVENDPAKT